MLGKIRIHSGESAFDPSGQYFPWRQRRGGAWRKFLIRHDREFVGRDFYSYRVVSVKSDSAKALELRLQAPGFPGRLGDKTDVISGYPFAKEQNAKS